MDMRQIVRHNLRKKSDNGMPIWSFADLLALVELNNSVDKNPELQSTPYLVIFEACEEMKEMIDSLFVESKT